MTLNNRIVFGKMVTPSEKMPEIMTPVFIIKPNGDKAVGMRLNPNVWYDGKKRDWMVGGDYYNAEVKTWLDESPYTPQEEGWVSVPLSMLKELIETAEDGYKLHIRNACHQEFLEEDRELLKKAKSFLASPPGESSPLVEENRRLKEALNEISEMTATENESSFSFLKHMRSIASKIVNK